MIASGSIGLEPRLKNPDETMNFMGALSGNNYITYNIFAIKFSASTSDYSSKITIGGYDKDLVGRNTIYWQQGSSMKRWNLTLHNLVYDKKSILPKPSWILVTTGESRLRMYRNIFESISKDLRSSHGYENCFYSAEDPMFRCYVAERSYSKFKILEIHLANITLYVEPEEYIKFVSTLLKVIGKRAQYR